MKAEDEVVLILRFILDPSKLALALNCEYLPLQNLDDASSGISP